MKWLEIGDCVYNPMDKTMRIDLHEGYEKALTKLDHFSHCHLFFLQKDRLDIVVARIVEADPVVGQLMLKSIDTNPVLISKFSGQLVDIKPYFSNEEVFSDADEPDECFFLNYKGCSPGSYQMHGSRSVILLEEENLPEDFKKAEWIDQDS